jgi:hypothetical protein
MANKPKHVIPTEGRRAAVHERDLRAGAYITGVIEGPRGEILPKVRLCRLARKHAEGNGLIDDKYFKGNGARLETYLLNNFPRIRKALWADGSYIVAVRNKQGMLAGYRRGNAADLEWYAAWACNVIERSAESENEDADLAKGVARLPRVNTSLLLPRGR